MNLKNMRECDNSKIHISNNTLLSICLLIMLDTLLLVPSLHCNTEHWTGLVSCAVLCVVIGLMKYGRITSTQSPSFYMATFSASLTEHTDFLPHSRDCSCYVSGPIPTPPPLWMRKHTDLCAHGFAHCPVLWHRPRLAN